MPRFSEDLAGPRDPRLCQACGSADDVRAWQEHDARDRPDIRIVVLCRPCSGKLIAPHPRLYRPLGVNEPFPAAMDLCRDCRFRDGVSCTHWRNKANGGPGLYPGITIAAPHRAHVYRGGGKGGWVDIWPEAAIACEARKPVGAPSRCRCCGAEDGAGCGDVSTRRVRVYDETSGQHLSTVSVIDVCQRCLSAGAEVMLTAAGSETCVLPPFLDR